MTLIGNISAMLGIGSTGLAVRRGARGRIVAPAPFLPDPLDPDLERNLLTAFDRDDTRQLRYVRYEDWYRNQQYGSGAMTRRAKERQRLGPRRASADVGNLYRFVSTVFSPVTRAVDADANGIFRNPVHVHVDDDPETDRLLHRILAASRFDTTRYKLARYGAMFGDVYLRVDPAAREGVPKLIVYPPTQVRVIPNPHDADETLAAVISYPFEDLSGSGSSVHVRTDILMQDATRTYLDGEPFGFDGAPSAFDNPLGVVPVLHVRNLDLGYDWGLPTFHNVLPTLDAINEIGSFLSNVVRTQADPIMVVYGAQEGDLTKGARTSPTDTIIYYIPGAGKDARVEMIEWRGNLPDVTSFIQTIKDDVTDALPELHVSKMQQQGAYSGFALTSMLFAFVEKIVTMRQTYTSAVREACTLAIAAERLTRGDTARLELFDPGFEIAVQLPPVLPVDQDALLNRLLALYEAHLIPGDEVLRQYGVPEDDIVELMARALEETQHRMDMGLIPDQNAPTGTAAVAGRTATQVANRRPGGPASASQRAAAGANNQPTNPQLRTGGRS